jgi:hypothetical protein
MAKRTKMPTDLNQWAKAIVDLATSNDPLPDPDEGKDARKVAGGRKGGIKGGRSRADRLSADERAECARHAARARWDR